MSTLPFARSGLGAAPALLGVFLLGLAVPANATPGTVHRTRDAAVRITGSSAAAVARCVNDARDGVIQTQQNACDNTAIAGNVLELDNVAIVVQPAGGGSGQYSARNATVDISSGPVTAIAECVNDARDGVIQTQQNACNNTAIASSMLVLSGVTVTVSAPSP